MMTNRSVSVSASASAYLSSVRFVFLLQIRLLQVALFFSLLVLVLLDFVLPDQAVLGLIARCYSLRLFLYSFVFFQVLLLIELFVLLQAVLVYLSHCSCRSGRRRVLFSCSLSFKCQYASLCQAVLFVVLVIVCLSSCPRPSVSVCRFLCLRAF